MARIDRARQATQNEKFVREWYQDNDQGLRASRDAGRRDRELDGDGVAGEVIFPDADAVSATTAVPSVRASAFPAATAILHLRSPTPLRTTDGWSAKSGASAWRDRWADCTEAGDSKSLSSFSSPPRPRRSPR